MPLRLVRRPKSPHWIIRGTVRQFRVEESSGTDDRRVAEEIRAKREAQILAESVYGRRATATFAEAALSYLEAGGDKRFLEPVLKHFGTTPLAKIDQDAIDQGARKLYPSVSASTRDRQFYTPTSAVLKHATKRHWCAAIILERPRAPPSRTVRPRSSCARKSVAALECFVYIQEASLFGGGNGKSDGARAEDPAEFFLGEFAAFLRLPQGVLRLLEILEPPLKLRGIDFRAFIEARILDGDRGGNGERLRQAQMFRRKGLRGRVAQRQQAEHALEAMRGAHNHERICDIP